MKIQRKGLVLDAVIEFMFLIMIWLECLDSQPLSYGSREFKPPILQGCWLAFYSGINGLVVCYCNALPARVHVSHGAWLIKIKIHI
jgi:hypothetical protein